jgi:hypothetical protein
MHSPSLEFERKDQDNLIAEFLNVINVLYLKLLNLFWPQSLKRDVTQPGKESLVLQWLKGDGDGKNGKAISQCISQPLN